MAFSMHERYALIRELSPRYQRSGKAERTRMLDEFVTMTGYTRCYASYVLANSGRKRDVVVKGRRVTVEIGALSGALRHRNRSRVYDRPVAEARGQLWAFSNGLCGKRLVVFVREVLPILERYGEVSLEAETRAKLLAMSSSTMDRLLAPTKANHRLRGRSGTKPGTLLKHHIPIRTFTDWSDLRPGFVEIDLVAHDGGIAYGDYIQTLDVTDVATGWTETRAVRNKAQCHVFDALQDVRRSIPFRVLGIDSDNGSEFINRHLLRFCEQERITFTRSRPYRKNDNCFVEQKNYSVVRTTVGYYRYDQPGQLALLHELYQILRLFTNFFQPSMKLREKIRIGSKVLRHYDQPMTPYRRLLQHDIIPDDTKRALRELYDTLNPAVLTRSLADLQHQLFTSALQAPKLTTVPTGYPAQKHPWRMQYRRDVGSQARKRPSDQSCIQSTTPAS